MDGGLGWHEQSAIDLRHRVGKLTAVEPGRTLPCVHFVTAWEGKGFAGMGTGPARRRGAPGDGCEAEPERLSLVAGCEATVADAARERRAGERRQERKT